jgi:glycosyltransferase involved in cell wall biosynthesis
LLAENGNVTDLADKLCLMMADEDRRREMAEAAVNNVQRFNIDHIAAKWKDLFDEVVHPSIV